MKKIIAVLVLLLALCCLAWSQDVPQIGDDLQDYSFIFKGMTEREAKIYIAGILDGLGYDIAFANVFVANNPKIEELKQLYNCFLLNTRTIIHVDPEDAKRAIGRLPTFYSDPANARVHPVNAIMHLMND